MKKLFLIILALFLTLSSAFASHTEQETSRPSYDTEISKHCVSCDIEGKFYHNVIVTVKSNNPLNNINGDSMVKITIKDVNEKIVFKKKIKAYMYIFSDGQIQVGKPKFHQIVISDKGICKIRLKEGIF